MPAPDRSNVAASAAQDEIAPIELGEVAEYALQVPLIEEEAPGIRPVPLPSQERAQRAAIEKWRRVPLSAILAANVISVVAIGALAWFWLGRAREARSPQPHPAPADAEKIVKAQAEPPEPLPNQTTAIDPQAVAASPAKAARRALQPVARPAAPTASSPASIDRVLYAVLAVDPGNNQRFRLGTAWGFAPRYLATSAAVVMGIEEVQREGLRAVVAPAGESREIRVRGMRVNPQYRQAFVHANSLRQQLENPKAPPTQTPPPPALGGGVERVGVPRAGAPGSEGQILGGPQVAVPPGGPRQGPFPGASAMTRRQLDDACWTQVRFDVGLLEVDQDVEEIFPIPPGPLASGPDELFVLAGLPFGLDECLWPESAPAAAPQRVSAPAAAGTSPLGLFFFLEFSGELEGRNWSGSPVVNQAGQVVAIYSRDTNPLDGAPRGPAMHAVVSTQLLRALAADVLK